MREVPLYGHGPWTGPPREITLEGRMSHGARPVHFIITMRWIRTSRLSVKKFSLGGQEGGEGRGE